jgi:hypothetical protein
MKKAASAEMETQSCSRRIGTVTSQFLQKFDSSNNKAGRRTELARLAGFEPTTPGFGGQYSIH